MLVQSFSVLSPTWLMTIFYSLKFEIHPTWKALVFYFFCFWYVFLLEAEQTLRPNAGEGLGKFKKKSPHRVSNLWPTSL
jgi:hypothetical protein